jgi:chromosome partitioning protein
LLGSVLPNAVAILNPKQIDCKYPYKELCGCGVGFKFMMALTAHYKKEADFYLKYLDLLPSNINLVGAELEMIDLPNRERVMKRVFESLKKEYDFIIIDCSPSLGLITTNSLCAADSIIIPVQCEYFALEGLGKLLNTIRIVQKELNKNLGIEGILLTMYDSRLRLSNHVVEDVKMHFQDLVFDTIIPRNTKLSEAPSFGVPVISHDVASKGSTTYLNLAREILQRNGMTRMDKTEKILD